MGSRLGFGAEFEESVRWRSTEDLQRQILTEVQTRAPEVLEDLAAQPFERYLQIPEQMQDRPSVMLWGIEADFGQYARPWRWAEICKQAREGNLAFIALQEALEQWARRHFKDVPNWLMLDALETLHVWRQQGSSQGPREWAPYDDIGLFHSPTLEEAPSFQFEYGAWRAARWSPSASAMP